MSRPSWVSWAMMSARLDIYSILGRTAEGVNGECCLAAARPRLGAGHVDGGLDGEVVAGLVFGAG